MRALVTGGLGFIGSHVVEELVREGFEVLVVDDLSTGSTQNQAPRARNYIGSYSSPGALSEITQFSPDFVFHLAALPRIQPSFDAPLEHHDVNVRGVIDLLIACAAIGVEAFVYSSSASVYGDTDNFPTEEASKLAPLSPYAVQKLAAEHYVGVLGKSLGIPNVSLRYFNPYGPRSFNLSNSLSAYSPVIGIFEHAYSLGDQLKVTGDGLQSRDFVHVSDVAKANVLAARSAVRLSGGVFNVCTGRATPIIEIAKAFSPHIGFLPERPGEARISVGSPALIRDSLSWNPTIGVFEYIESLL